MDKRVDKHIVVPVVPADPHFMRKAIFEFDTPHQIRMFQIVGHQILQLTQRHLQPFKYLFVKATHTLEYIGKPSVLDLCIDEGFIVEIGRKFLGRRGRKGRQAQNFHSGNAEYFYSPQKCTAILLGRFGEPINRTIPDRDEPN